MQSKFAICADTRKQRESVGCALLRRAATSLNLTSQTWGMALRGKLRWVQPHLLGLSLQALQSVGILDLPRSLWAYCTFGIWESQEIWAWSFVETFFNLHDFLMYSKNLMTVAAEQRCYIQDWWNYQQTMPHRLFWCWGCCETSATCHDSAARILQADKTQSISQAVHPRQPYIEERTTSRYLARICFSYLL